MAPLVAKTFIRRLNLIVAILLITQSTLAAPQFVNAQSSSEVSDTHVFLPLIQSGEQADAEVAQKVQPLASMSVNPSGTDVHALAIDPSNAQIVYAGTNGSGIFKSPSGGVSWTVTNLPSGPSVFIDGIAIDPSNPQTVYACAFVSPPWVGIFKSTDGGTSWSKSGFPDTACYTLAINRSSPQILYAGSTSQLFKSTNGGTSWSKLDVPPGGGSIDAISLALDPSNTQVVYLGGEAPNGVFKSTNGGTSWSKVLTTPSGVYALIIDPTSPQVLYAGTRGSGVFKSTNGGNSWSAINSGITNNDVRALAIDSSNHSIVYAGTRGSGVFKSTNGGNSWSAINNGITNNDVFALAIDSKGTVYVGTGGGVFKLTDIPIPQPIVLHAQDLTPLNDTAVFIDAGLTTVGVNMAKVNYISFKALAPGPRCAAQATPQVVQIFSQGKVIWEKMTPGNPPPTLEFGPGISAETKDEYVFFEEKPSVLVTRGDAYIHVDYATTVFSLPCTGNSFENATGALQLSIP